MKSGEVTQLKAKLTQKDTEMKNLEGKFGSVIEMQEEVKILRVLASTESSAMDMYNVLKDHQSMEMRKLAMQSGMASAACEKLLSGLEKAGLVKFERASPDDTNPKITLVSI